MVHVAAGRLGLEAQVLGGKVQHGIGPGEEAQSSGCGPQAPGRASRRAPLEPHSPLGGVHVGPRDGRGRGHHPCCCFPGLLGSLDSPKLPVVAVGSQEVGSLLYLCTHCVPRAGSGHVTSQRPWHMRIVSSILQGVQVTGREGKGFAKDRAVTRWQGLESNPDTATNYKCIGTGEKNSTYSTHGTCQDSLPGVRCTLLPRGLGGI